MNNPRTFLLLALFALGYLIYSQWQMDYNPQVARPAAATTGEQADTPVAATPLPPDSAEIPQASSTTPLAAPTEVASSERLVP